MCVCVAGLRGFREAEPEMQMAAISFRWLNIRQQGRTQFEQIVCTKALMHMCEKEGMESVREREGRSDKMGIYMELKLASRLCVYLCRRLSSKFSTSFSFFLRL